VASALATERVRRVPHDGSLVVTAEGRRAFAAQLAVDGLALSR
jgi:hypothetical protein